MRRPRLLVSLLVLSPAHLLAQPPTHQDATPSCNLGAIYTSTSGKKLIIKRVGIGSIHYPGDEADLERPTLAVDFIITEGGVRGAIVGQTPSWMYAADPDYIDRLPMRWSPPDADPDRFFRVMSDDGEEELFTFNFVRCARSGSAH